MIDCGMNPINFYEICCWCIENYGFHDDKQRQGGICNGPNDRYNRLQQETADATASL